MWWHRRSGAAQNSRIFISYRRGDSARHAELLRDHLAAALPHTHIFMDLHDIHPGDDFPGRIAEALRGSGVLLALVGTDWMGATVPGRRRRIDDERDFVR